MPDDVRLTAQVREKVGSAETSRLRSSGRVPANLYGFKKPGLSLSLPTEDVDRLIAVGSRVVDVDVDGNVDKAVVQELQWDTFSTHIMHVDLKRVDPDAVTTVDVPVQLRGEPVGLKDGGQVRQLVKYVSVTCPDYRIPKAIEVRIGALQVGESVSIADITPQDTVTINTSADTVVVELFNPKKAQSE